MSNSDDIGECIRRRLNHYFKDLDGEMPHAIYAMVLASIEKPMFEVVLQKADGNQTLAAQMLGISRSTLRRKLTEHQLS